MHGGAAGKVTYAASNECQDREHKNRPPYSIVERQAFCEFSEHAHQTPLDHPQRQPEEKLDNEKFVQHHFEIVFEARIWLHLTRFDSHSIEIGRDRGKIERGHDRKGDQGSIDEEVFHLQRDPTVLEPARSRAHGDEDGGDAETCDQAFLETLSISSSVCPLLNPSGHGGDWLPCPPSAKCPESPSFMLWGLYATGLCEAASAPWKTSTTVE